MNVSPASWPFFLALALASTGCTLPPRIPPSLADTPRGQRTEHQHAVLFVPENFTVPDSGQVPLFVHFQGGARIAEQNFVRMRQAGVLLASRLAGFSSAFSDPYRDPQVFRNQLETAAGELSHQAGRTVRFEPITVTFFSAGYGAVRELLKEPEFFARIRNLVAADSIYASVVDPQVRAPDATQMIDFMRFAQRAARGEGSFVVLHGEYQTPYASTAECANLLLASVAGQRRPAQRFTERGVPIAAEAHVGGFHLYTFDEATPGFHVDCLHMIPEMVRRHAAGRRR